MNLELCQDKMDHFNMKVHLLTAVSLPTEREAPCTLRALSNFPLHHLVKKSNMPKLVAKKKLGTSLMRLSALLSSTTDLSVKTS